MEKIGIYVIAERGKKVRCYKDHHELLLYDVKKMLGLFRKVGLKATFLKKELSEGRGLFIGVKE